MWKCLRCEKENQNVEEKDDELYSAQNPVKSLRVCSCKLENTHESPRVFYKTGKRIHSEDHRVPGKNKCGSERHVGHDIVRSKEIF